MTARTRIAPLLALCLVVPGPATAQEAPAEEGWIALFNGKDLTGWTPKITGSEAGENYADTFRVEDGLLKVSFDGYDEFGGRFGHLVSDESYSSYRLRVEYRFVGDQCPGGPGWAIRNSGAMIHSQSAESMRTDQEFPVSIEVQFLGGLEQGERPTANLCTPGTHVEMDGELLTRHCTDSTSETYRGDRWVTVEVEVNGDGLIRHLVDGEVVIEYRDPQLDPDDADARRLRDGDDLLLTGGHIALQSESHPIEFRKVELLPLD
ncbi:3-keto-disaccharide hydrolase [Tautonia plasticadhaerens]|uniref:3-keto-alpha-glucoside-1,2-lyase/3-keto-2-hydroxy-glucal hydratase domain-containing protein n=1 Tax=Tautonia plasticadhaerens TaxID=2527974 RepID=A0A518H4X4_9BACT|nr:DUF1080 domain-containing protein [Tautonia plasticadhaerens]QDV35882.1 hypothetical protein ElP_37900 [Tautonia plasticadhaerens]